MGPLSFLLLINDALKDINLRWKYVDDSTKAVDIDTINLDISPLQNNISKLQQWTSVNDVSINATTTVVIHIN